MIRAITSTKVTMLLFMQRQGDLQYWPANLTELIRFLQRLEARVPIEALPNALVEIDWDGEYGVDFEVTYQRKRVDQDLLDWEQQRAAYEQAHATLQRKKDLTQLKLLKERYPDE